MQYRRRQLNKQNRAEIVVRLAVLILAAMIGSCSDHAKAPSPSVSPEKTQKQAIATAPTKTETATKPEEVAAATYAYNRAGRRDPFAPIIERENKKAKVGDRPPLERYSLSELKLTGIIWGGFGYNAMLEAPDKKGYFIRVGTVIGPNRGVVKKITKNMLVIEEKNKTAAGETERKEIIVELRKKQEATP